MVRFIDIEKQDGKTVNEHGIHLILSQYSEGRINTSDALYALDLKDFSELEALMLTHYIPLDAPSEEEISEQIRSLFGDIYKQDEKA